MNDMLVYDWIAENARRFPDKIATIDIHSGRNHSYAAMHERVARIAGHLSAAIAILAIIMAAFSLIWLRDGTKVTVR